MAINTGWFTVLGLFFLAFGIYHWFSPIIVAFSVDLWVDPHELNPLQRLLGRLVAVGLIALGTGILYFSVRVWLAS